MKIILTIYIVLYMAICVILAIRYQFIDYKINKLLREKYPEKLEEFYGVNTFTDFLRQFLKRLLPFYKVPNNASPDLSRHLIKLRNSWIFLVLWFIIGGCLVFLLSFILIALNNLLRFATI